jgi:hypothetical protein
MERATRRNVKSDSRTHHVAVAIGGPAELGRAMDTRIRRPRLGCRGSCEDELGPIELWVKRKEHHDNGQ